MLFQVPGMIAMLATMQSLTGVVARGKRHGTKLGYPTANLMLGTQIEEGVYAGRVQFENRQFDAAIFVDATRNILEAHLLDFTEDIYGKVITVNILQRIRERKVFLDEESLKQAIAADIIAIRTLLQLRV
jgi:riboflavin kinase/FMN adenylyltransferase